MRNTGSIEVRKLHPLFGAEITGIDITRPLSAREFGPIRAAFEEHSVLLFRDQAMDDDMQIAFSENFGPLETTLSANPAAGTKFARQSNLDIMTGEPIPPDDMRMIYQKANYFWHSDSSFKRVPSLCSILTARVCPPEGGNTEFLNMRAAWDALPPALQATIHPLVAEHALAHSRDRVQKGILSSKSLSELPPVKQRMFRDNPINGRRALYIGAPAGRILDWPEPMSKAILWELAQRAEQPEFMMSHAWREGDVIVWDNRAVLHRATHYDAVKHKRLMQRTTIGGDELTVPQYQMAEAVSATPLPDGMPSGARRLAAVATITIGLSMAVLSNSMTNLALPYIAKDLAITAESSIWIVNAYQIALMIMLLPVAALGDIVGYRTVYRWGLVIFSLASIGCVAAPTLSWLITARTLQGLGGAAIMAIQPALVRSIYPRASLGRGLGFNTTVVATSLAAGPSLGAALLAITNWPILFAVYIPLGVISFVLAGRFLPVTTHAKRPFDVISAVLSGGTFGLLIFGIDGVGHNHPVPVIMAELVGSAVFCTLFVWRQRRLADPMMPIDIFSRPIFSLSIAASTCTFAAQGLAFVSLPFFFHTVLGRDATATGLLLTAWPLALAGVAPIAGRLADRHHAGALGAIGLACMASGLVLTALLPPDPSAANIMWRLVLCGAGFGIFASPNNRLMMNAVPRDRSGSAGGIIASARTLGQTMGAALVSLVFGLFDFSGGGAADAARAAIWLGAGFALTALILSSLRLRH